MSPEFDAFMDNVRRHMIEKVDAARRCGALPEDVNEVVLYRMAIAIVGEEMAPSSKDGKKMLANLRHFI